MDLYDKVMDLARRRGFIWQSYEIYGGVRGFIDLGPLGVMLKRRIEEKWRRFFADRLGLLEIESPVISPRIVFEASGHLEHFKDPMTVCTGCGRAYRLDHLIKDSTGIPDSRLEGLSLEDLDRLVDSYDIRCPQCGSKLGEPEYFLTMFETRIGPLSGDIGYARPETAQGMFVAFKRLLEYARGSLPFGVAQIGRVMRNEISPRQGPIRLREFTIAEFEFFFDPDDRSCPFISEVEGEELRILTAERRMKGLDEPIIVTVGEAVGRGLIKLEWLAYFMALAKRFLEELGVPDDKQRFIEKLDSERAHYSIQGFDQEVYLSRWGWIEVSGHNYRTDYDLSRHQKFSGVELTVFKPYPYPVKAKRLVVKPDYRSIGSRYREKARTILDALGRMDPYEVRRIVSEKGLLELEGCRIEASELSFVEEEYEESGRKFIAHVVEPSFGVERLLYIALEYAYREVDDRVVLKLPRDLAPIQVAIYPLLSRDGLPEKAYKIYRAIKDAGFKVEYDESGSIGRRYARADEIGIPIVVTIDYKSLEDDTVTLRDRDTWRQVRVKVCELEDKLRGYLEGRASFDELGVPV
ncbi:MAG: glycine--tRNA ligase [Candidatus Bathyarchaeia archaeon]